MSALQIHVEGIGLWSPALGDFAALKAQQQGIPSDAPAARPPAPTVARPAEMALDDAWQPVAMVQ